jgi:RND family efflux transporter MFP subunit
MYQRCTSFGALHLMVALFLMSAIQASGAEAESYDGLIEPYEVVDIGASTEGIVATVAVDRSSPVEQGQTLVSLESAVERAALKKAVAMAGEEGEIGLQRTQLAFAKRVHKRVRNVSAVSLHDKDQAATNIAITEFKLQKALEKNTLARLEVKRAVALLARRSIQSPISGVVVERYVSPGEYVNNQPLLRVAQIDPLRVEVIVPARLFGKIAPGMTATILPELDQYAEQTATVKLVDRVIDSASSTFGVRLELPNPDQEIPSGLRCQVQFHFEETLQKIEAVPPVEPALPHEAHD